MKNIFFVLLMAGAITGCKKEKNEDPDTKVIIVSASGDITPKVNEFRSLLGDVLNTTPGQTSGRREINWDGAPVAVTNNNTFPLDFFNNTDAAGPNARKRGLQYVNNGTLIRLDSSDFSEIDASYADQFEPFSRKKMIIPVGTNVSEIVFKVPGTTTDASVKGFGVVFSDVDDANSTDIEFFNGTKSLGVFKAPAAAGAAKYSFLGVQFPVEKITRLKITAGNAALAAGVKDMTVSGTKDLVAIDDVLYSEPLILQ